MKFIGEQLGVTISKSLLEQENARLMELTAEMRRELETRKIVERAKGLLQQKFGISEEDAYFRLRNQSRRLRRPCGIWPKPSFSPRIWIAKLPLGATSASHSALAGGSACPTHRGEPF